MEMLMKRIPGSVIRTTIVMSMITGLFTLSGYGQTDTVKKSRNFKNTIRVNITNPMLFGSECNIIGYERVITKHSTASLNIGRLDFPKMFGFNTDSIGITNQNHDKGFNISLDYRFYLRKENKYDAPRGIYIGPYYGFNRFSRDLTWNLSTGGYSGEINTNVKFTANLVGVQMGYQFVLWNRFTIDMILMGPGAWFFVMKTNFDTTLPADDEALLLEKLNEIVKEKFPGSDFTFTGGDFEARKTTSTKTMGFRYMINLGFRF